MIEDPNVINNLNKLITADFPRISIKNAKGWCRARIFILIKFCPTFGLVTRYRRNSCQSLNLFLQKKKINKIFLSKWFFNYYILHTPPVVQLTNDTVQIVYRIRELHWNAVFIILILSQWWKILGNQILNFHPYILHSLIHAKLPHKLK